MTQEKADAFLARITPTGDAADLAGCDVIVEAVFEDQALKHRVLSEAEAHALPGRAAGSQHLDAADHRAGRGRAAAGRRRRHALLLAGGQDAAGRADRGGADQRRRARPRLRRRPADRQDADRRPGQPRLLHQPGVRHPRAGGRRAARRGPGADEHRAGRAAGRLPGRAADPARRGHAHPAAEDQRRGGEGRLDGGPPRARRRARARRAGPDRQGRRAGLLRLGAGEAGLARARRAVPGARRRSRSPTPRSGCCSRWRSRRRAASRSRS